MHFDARVRSGSTPGTAGDRGRWRRPVFLHRCVGGASLVFVMRRDPRSVGTPGLVAMLAAAHAAGLRLPWARLFEPAIRLAEDNFEALPRLHRPLGPRGALCRPGAVAHFFDADGRPWPIGHRLRNGPSPTASGALRPKAEALRRGPLAERRSAMRCGVACRPIQRMRAGCLGRRDLLAYAPIAGLFQRLFAVTACASRCRAPARPRCWRCLHLACITCGRTAGFDGVCPTALPKRAGWPMPTGPVASAIQHSGRCRCGGAAGCALSGPARRWSVIWRASGPTPGGHRPCGARRGGRAAVHHGICPRRRRRQRGGADFVHRDAFGTGGWPVVFCSHNQPHRDFSTDGAKRLRRANGRAARWRRRPSCSTGAGGSSLCSLAGRQPDSQLRNQALLGLLDGGLTGTGREPAEAGQPQRAGRKWSGSDGRSHRRPGTRGHMLRET